MHRFFLLLLLSLPFFCRAQILVSGSVADSAGGRPLDGASVFLANTSIGASTNSDGKFRLPNVPSGQYDLIVSLIGYHTYTQTISVQGNIPEIKVRLARKPVMIPVVSIMSKAERERLLGMFISDFIGSEQQGQCRIKNTDDITLEYDRKQNVLIATAEKFLIIENAYFGYRLKYLLNSFKSNYSDRTVFYDGQALFEELPASESKKKRWKKNRENTFVSSPMHFYRNLIAMDTLNFTMHTLIRENNPERPPDSIIRARQERFRGMPDSLQYWSDKAGLPRTRQILIDTAVNISSVTVRTNLEGIFALRFDHFLQVTAHPKKQGEKGITRAERLNPSQSSVIHLLGEYSLFDRNGVVINPIDVMYEGFWSGDRIGRMLPYNYQPGQ